MPPPAKSRHLVVALFLAAIALFPARAQDPTAALGLQQARASSLTWTIGEAGHPGLGNIRYAYMKNLQLTPVGPRQVYSRAYVSCGKTSGRMAIELSNITAPDDPGGLQPASMPRLFCRRPAAAWDTTLVDEELLVAWEVDVRTGDALAKDLGAPALRACAAIRVAQEVVLPADWGTRTARIELEIPPYNRELDSIFAGCGERTAYAQAPAAAPTAPALPKAQPAAKAPATPVAKAVPAPQAAPTDDYWEPSRVTSSGKTNVRRGPSLTSPVVIQLHPGSVVLIQATDTDWWRAKSASGPAWQGYIREDRLVFK